MAEKKNRTALVLGSGGARGLAHIGVIKALEENHVPIDIITGTSIGALIGGLYASGKDAGSMERIIADVNKVMVAKILMPKFSASGFIDNKRMFSFIKELVGDIKIEDLQIPFAAVATDLVTGEQVVFNKGSLIDAIMASVAIPAVFQPVLLGGRYLIDGGLSNPLPISVANKMKARRIIAVNVSPNPERITGKIKNRKTKEITSFIKNLPARFSNLLNEKGLLSDVRNGNTKSELPQTQVYPPTLMRVFLQSISITTNNLIIQHLRYARPDILISPQIEDFDMIEFYKGTEIIKRGYDETINLLPKILKKVSKK